MGVLLQSVKQLQQLTFVRLTRSDVIAGLLRPGAVQQSDGKRIERGRGCPDNLHIVQLVGIDVQ